MPYNGLQILRFEIFNIRLGNGCWDKYIKGKSINGIQMHVKRTHYGVWHKKCFMSYVHILHVNSLASIDTST